MPPIQPGYLACHSWNLMCHLFLERPSPTFLGQVDPLSLSCLLLSHGFEEGPARRALRKTMNDTQVGFEGKKNVETWALEDDEFFRVFLEVFLMIVYGAGSEKAFKLL